MVNSTQAVADTPVKPLRVAAFGNKSVSTYQQVQQQTNTQLVGNSTMSAIAHTTNKKSLSKTNHFNEIINFIDTKPNKKPRAKNTRVDAIGQEIRNDVDSGVMGRTGCRVYL